MIELLPLQREDCEKIVDWNADKDQNFLFQWAGRRIYKYPLDSDQIAARISVPDTVIFKIVFEKKMIGTVELHQIDSAQKCAKVCRFFIPEPNCGSGIGRQVLELLSRHAFNELGLNRLELGVYTFNVRALRCYEKSGFLVKEFHEDPENPRWNSYIMEKKKDGSLGKTYPGSGT